MKFSKLIAFTMFLLALSSCQKKELNGTVAGRIMVACEQPASNTTFTLFVQTEGLYQAYQYKKVKDFQTDENGNFQVNYQVNDPRTMIISTKEDVYLPFNSLMYDIPVMEAGYVGDLYYSHQSIDFLAFLKVNRPYTSSDTLYIESDNIFPTYKIAGPFTDGQTALIPLYTFTPNRSFTGTSTFSVNVFLNSTKLISDKKVEVKDFCPLEPPYNQRFLKIEL